MQQLNYSDIVLKHRKSVVNSRSECDITTKIGNKIFATPVCCSNMKSILTPHICRLFDDRNWFYVYHRIDGVEDVTAFIKGCQPYYNLDTQTKHKFNFVSISIGIGNEWEAALKRWSDEKYTIDYITIDVALSYNDNIIPTINAVKKYYPNAYLIVGNGCIPEWITWLENLGVNCAKVGIGVSKSCRTRQYTGFGSSTVSDLIECVNVSKTIDIMSDGGLTVEENGEVWIGDINKALAIGSDFVMSGAIFSKCINSPAIINGYFGNASADAKGHQKHIEGTNIKIVTNGFTIDQMCNLIEDSIKSGISYAGGKDLSCFNSVEWFLCH